MAESPVLLLLFNRPDLTQGLISILQSVRPEKIYIAVDGPRRGKPGEAEKVGRVLEIARSIDWTSNIQFLIREQNLGCGPSVISALDWFFDQEEQGIILEDDCHPHPDFFPFCNQMLVRYADDHRVATIAGHSLAPSSLRHPSGYFFSKYTEIWGWATWRRFWKSYDAGLTSLTAEGWRKVVFDHTEEGLDRANWLYQLGECLAEESLTWDLRVQLSAWKNDQLNVVPGNNLITNRGVREDATWTTQRSVLTLCNKQIPLSGPFPYQTPEVDHEMDYVIFLRKLFGEEFIMKLLVRSEDEEYSRMSAQNEHLFDLNRILTRTADQQHENIQQLTQSLKASTEAFEAKIAALEQQVVLSSARTKWIDKLRDRIRQIFRYKQKKIDKKAPHLSVI